MDRSVFLTVQEKCLQGARYSLMLTAFALPFSTSLLGAASILAVFFWLCSGRARDLCWLLRRHLPAACAALLLAMLLIGISYTPAPLAIALEFLKKYRELLLFLLSLLVLRRDPVTARRVEICFLGGCGVLLLVSYLAFWQLLPVTRFGYSLVHHITHSFFMALLAFWCLHRLFAGKHLLAWLALLLATLTNIFYIAPGRTGMVVVVMLVTLVFVQRLRFRYSLLCIAAATCLLGLAYLSSDNLQNRVQEAITEVQLQQQQPGQSRTSLGQRLDWWANGIELVGKSPWYGSGTGSFGPLQQELVKKLRTTRADNPHNEYLLLAVQTGLIGLFCFLGMLLSQLVYSLKIPEESRYLLQGVVCAMAVGCLFNSFLYDSHQGHFYVLVSSLLSAPYLPNRSTTES